MAETTGKDPLFRLIIDELSLSADHKAKALSHIADLHALVVKTIKWDEQFIAQLSRVLEEEQPKPDALDVGIPEIVKQFAPKNGGGAQAG